MKKKTNLLTILFFTLLVAGSGYTKIANAGCVVINSGAAPTVICW